MCCHRRQVNAVCYRGRGCHGHRRARGYAPGGCYHRRCARMQPASLSIAPSRTIDSPAPNPLNRDTDVERGVLPLAPLTDAAEPPSYKETDNSHDGRTAPISQISEIKPTRVFAWKNPWLYQCISQPTGDSL